MKSFLTSYSQPSLLSRLPSRIENRCCHEPTYLLKTGLLSLNLFTTCPFPPTRSNRFTCSTSASTANFSSKEFYPTQNRIVGSKPLHQDTHTKPEKRPFYPNSLFLLGNRNNPKSITARNEFSVSGDRKRLSLGKKQHVPTNRLPSVRKPFFQDGLGKKEKKANRKTLGTGLWHAKTGNPESAKLSKGLSLKQNSLAQKKIQRVLQRSLLPEKFINLLMANGEKDKARRCLTQALFSITTHCQKHNLQNNSPLQIFTNSFFKQESTESKPSSADNSLKRKDLGTVQQETGTNELVAPLSKGKSNTLLVQSTANSSQIYKRKGVQSNLGTKQDANPGNVSNPLRDVGLVLVETRLDNLSNNRYSGTKKRELYPSVKEEKGLLSRAKGTPISRLNHIERVEKRLVLKQNGSFFLFVKQKPPHFALHQVVGIDLQEKQIGRFKLPLSLPFCGKSFETTLDVFSSLAVHKKQNNPFLSSIRLSLKERFLTSEKGFFSLALHKKVQQSYLCSDLLHLVRTKGNEKTSQTLLSSWLCKVPKTNPCPVLGTDNSILFFEIRRPTNFTKCPTYTTTQTQQIHFKTSLPYSALFNWREKGLNPLFGFFKQSQRFLMELCKSVPNRFVKGTKEIRQNNLFGSFPLLSCFYSARTPSSLFSRVPTPSITSKPLQTLFTRTKNIVGTVIGLQNQPVGSKPLHKVGLQSNKQVPQNDLHSNTKDKETFLCFTQGIPPVAKKVFERENHPTDIKSVHTKVLLKGIQRVQPTLEVRRVRKGRNTFQVPSVVKQKRGEKVGIKWIIDSAKSKKRKGNKLFSLSLANQLVQSFDRLGEARSKRNELLKLAESNRPFLRFRWW